MKYRVGIDLGQGEHGAIMFGYENAFIVVAFLPKGEKLSLSETNYVVTAWRDSQDTHPIPASEIEAWLPFIRHDLEEMANAKSD